MSNNNIELAGVLFGIKKPIEIPERLREFLTTDGMDGVADLNLMLKDPRLCKRIPQDIRAEYEFLYYQVSKELEEICNRLEEITLEMRSNPRECIHELIQQSLDN